MYKKFYSLIRNNDDLVNYSIYLISPLNSPLTNLKYAKKKEGRVIHSEVHFSIFKKNKVGKLSIL